MVENMNKRNYQKELDVLLVPLGQAVEMVMDNEICCNSSAHGILRVARMLGV